MDSTSWFIGLFFYGKSKLEGDLWKASYSDPATSWYMIIAHLFENMFEHIECNCCQLFEQDLKRDGGRSLAPKTTNAASASP